MAATDVRESDYPADDGGEAETRRPRASLETGDDDGDEGQQRVTSPDFIAKKEEEEEEEEEEDRRYPLKVTYCGVCTLPTEFCQFTPDAARCRQWLETHIPEAFARMSLQGDDHDRNGGEEEEQEEEEEKRRQKRGGRGTIRPKKKAASATAAARVTIAKVPRAKKKFVTRVCGLAAAAGVDPKEAKRFFAQRFSCGASLAGADEIVVQGDVTDDLAAAIAERWAQVDPECIHDLGEVKK